MKSLTVDEVADREAAAVCECVYQDGERSGSG